MNRLSVNFVFTFIGFFYHGHSRNPSLNYGPTAVLHDVQQNSISLF